MDPNQLALFYATAESKGHHYAADERTQTVEVHAGPHPTLNPTYEAESQKVAWQCPRCVKCYVVWGDHADPINNGKLKGAVSRIRGHISKHHGEKYMIGMHPFGYKKTQPKYNGDAPNSCPAKIAGKNVKCVLPCAEGAEFCDVHSKMPREKVVIFNKDIHVPKKLLTTMSKVVDHQLMPVECQLDPLGQVLNFDGVDDCAQSSNELVPTSAASTSTTTQYRKRKSSQPSGPTEMSELPDGTYARMPELKDRKHKAPRTIADLLPAPSPSCSVLTVDGKRYPMTIHQNVFDAVSYEQPPTKVKSRVKKIIQHSGYIQAVNAGTLPSTILPVSVDQLIGFPQQPFQAHDNDVQFTSTVEPTPEEMQFTPHVAKNPVGRPRKASSIPTNSTPSVDESIVASTHTAVESLEVTPVSEQHQDIEDINILGEENNPKSIKTLRGKGCSITVDPVVFSADKTESLESSPFAFVATDGNNVTALTSNDPTTTTTNKTQPPLRKCTLQIEADGAAVDASEPNHPPVVEASPVMEVPPAVDESSSASSFFSSVAKSTAITISGTQNLKNKNKG